MSKSITLRNAGGGAVAKAGDLASKIKARQQASLRRQSNIDRVALLDRSGSMDAADAFDLNGLPCTRATALEQAWKKLAPEGAGRLGAFVFADSPVPVRGAATGNAVALPSPGGVGTNFIAALQMAATFAGPRLRTLLVSDGEHNAGGDPVVAALMIGTPVDTVFVGPPDGEGRDTLKRIADATGGTYRDFSSKFDATRFLAHCLDVLQLREGR